MTDSQPLRTPPASKGRSSSTTALAIEGRDGARQVIALGAEEIVLGRGEQGVSVRLQERDISRRHASFSYANGAVWVEDLGSSNGTRVNGERIQGKRRIREGDLVQIGGYDIAVMEAELPQPPVAVDSKPVPPPISGRAAPPPITEPLRTIGERAGSAPKAEPPAPRPTASAVAPAAPPPPSPAPPPVASAAVVAPPAPARPSPAQETSHVDDRRPAASAAPAAEAPLRAPPPATARVTNKRPRTPARNRTDTQRSTSSRSNAGWAMAFVIVGAAALFLGWAAGRLARTSLPEKGAAASTGVHP